MLQSACGYGRILLALVVAAGVPSCRSDSPVESATTAPGLERVATVQDPGELGVGRSLSIPAQMSIVGEWAKFEPGSGGGDIIVVAMTSVGCPVSTKYGPRLASIETDYASRGVRFVYVNTVAAESLSEMRDQVRRFGFKGAYLPDREQAVVKVLGARTTAEVFVLDASRKLVFRGAVDDQYGVGIAADRPKRRFLREAIDAVLDHRSPPVEATWAPGCLIDAPQASEASVGAEALTYYGRISRILDSSCIDCHRTGGAAPFSLTSPSSIDGRAAMMEAVVRDGLMPPSHGVAAATEGRGVWLNRHELPNGDRERLLAWLRAGRPIGDSSTAMPAKTRPLGWTIGIPDHIIMTPGLTLDKEGPLRFERFAIPIRIDDDQWVTAIEFKPVKAGTIHHARAWLLAPGAPAPAPGEEVSGQFLGAFSPGYDRVEYASGAARRLPRGSTLLVDVYARPMGIRMNASLRIGMRTRPIVSTSGSIQREARSFAIRPAAFEIAPGQPRVVHTAQITLEEQTTVAALTPYLRARGRSIKLDARLPDGSVTSLIDATVYDFRWPSRFEFAAPITLPAGTQLRLEGVHDNSAGNPVNPDPAARVKYGPGVAEDELTVFVETLAEAK